MADFPTPSINAEGSGTLALLFFRGEGSIGGRTESQFWRKHRSGAVPDIAPPTAVEPLDAVMAGLCSTRQPSYKTVSPAPSSKRYQHSASLY